MSADVTESLQGALYMVYDGSVTVAGQPVLSSDAVVTSSWFGRYGGAQ